MNPVQNNEKTGLWAGVLIGLAGLTLLALPRLLGVDMMRVGFGRSCIGLFVLLTGLITSLMFWRRVQTLEGILAEKDILARWTYNEGQGRQQVETEFKRAKGYNRTLFLVMVFWFVLIGAGFVIYDYFKTGELNGLFAGLFFGILLILGAFAWLTPIFWRRRALKASREVIISRHGVLLNGALHSWSGPLEGLESVHFQAEPPGPALVFSIRAPSRAEASGYTTQTLIVAVPAGKQDAAQNVVNTLGGAL